MSTAVASSQWSSGRWFSLTFGLFAGMAFVLTQQLPLTMSMIAVFLFAGPHNYLEFRYFLTRLPARAGRLKTFFCVSVAGVLGLSLFYPAISYLAVQYRWSDQSFLIAFGIWNSALILWIASLAWIRSHQPPRRDWWFIWPAALFCCGALLLKPVALPMLLVFVHPLMGLWILDQELAKSRPAWRSGYRLICSSLPVAIIAFLVMPANGNWLTPVDHDLISGMLRTQISRHVGAQLLPGDFGYRLIAVHAFLELLHYGVWIVAIPAASGRVLSDGFQTIPLMRAGKNLRRGVQILLGAGLAVVGLLWLGFVADYSMTRDLYFTIAVLHVFAEVPFLLRML